MNTAVWLPINLCVFLYWVPYLCSNSHTAHTIQSNLISSAWAPSLSSQTPPSWQRIAQELTYAVIWPIRLRGPFYWGHLRMFLFAYLGKSLGGFSLLYTIPIRKNVTLTILWPFRMKVALWTAEWRDGWWFYHWSFESANIKLYPIFVFSALSVYSQLSKPLKSFIFSKRQFCITVSVTCICPKG